MAELVHILWARGHYIGQTRERGHKRWTTVTGNCKRAEAAMAQAVRKMTPNDYRARVLFIDSGGWYEPNIVMECNR